MASDPNQTTGGDRYTEGVCGDGAVILYDGLPLSIEEVVSRLNASCGDAVFTPQQVQHLHQHQFGPFDPPMQPGFHRMHPFTCPNRSDGRHFDNGADVGALIPTVRGWICQCCDYTQGWAHEFMLNGRQRQ